MGDWRRVSGSASEWEGGVFELPPKLSPSPTPVPFPSPFLLPPTSHSHSCNLPCLLCLSLHLFY